MNKKVLFLNATVQDIHFILTYRKLGYYVITSGNRPDFVGHKYADEYICGDYSNYEEILQIAKDNDVCAISGGTSDKAYLCAAYVSEKLGLKGYDSYEVTEILHVKDKFREFTSQNKIKAPLAQNYDNPDAIKAAIDDFKLPLIIKPVDSAGGKGVSIVSDKNEVEECARKAFSASVNGKIVIEELIEGKQHAISAFIVNGRVKAFYNYEEYSFLNQFMVSTMIGPARHSENITEKLIEEIEKIADILKLVDGQVHVQYMVKDNDISIIEIMRRCVGNYVSSMINDSVGIAWLDWYIRAQLGLDCSHIPARMGGGFDCASQVIMSEADGIIDSIVIDDRIKKNVYNVDIWLDNGYEITDYMNEKIGIVLLKFESKTEREFYEKNYDKLIRVNLR